jgi:hypothetical protein
MKLPAQKEGLAEHDPVSDRWIQNSIKEKICGNPMVEVKDEP